MFVSIITPVEQNPHRAAGETLRCVHNLSAFVQRAHVSHAEMLAENLHGNTVRPNTLDVSADDACEAEMIEMATFALARKAGTLMRLLNRAPDHADRIRAEVERTATEMRVLYAELRNISPDATAQWDDRKGTEAHMTGEERAIRNNKGTHHTDSALGDASTTRDNANLDSALGENRAHHFNAGLSYGVSERDISRATFLPLD